MPPPAYCETCGRKVDETKAIYDVPNDCYMCNETCEAKRPDKENEDG